MADLSLDLCGVKLKNPIIAASGTFGFGREYDELYDIGQLGGISVKGLSLLPRTGNPPSRIAETPSGMLNSVGLQNPGVESFIENDLPWLLTKNVAVIANITGTSVEQYVQMAERLAGTGVHLLEMNISCPNVHEGGVAFGAGMPDFASNLHGANERINIRDSLTACKIFALAIAELCGE